MKSRWLITLSTCIAVVLGSLSIADARPKPKRSKKGEFEANKGFGIGFQFGVPTGITGKYYLSKDTAIDFAIGNYYRRSNGGVNFHVDFLWHPFLLGKTESLWIPFYLGVGARILDHNRDRYGEDLHIGVRAPFGIALDFTNIPIDIFLELALVADVVHDGNHRFTDFNLALGLRYYFN